MLEDYLEARPENEGRLRELLAAGRLEVGPSYILPDELLVAGESLVRNLLLGRFVCERFGARPSPVGYMPDSFGHPLQLPQIPRPGSGSTASSSRAAWGNELDELGVLFRGAAPEWQRGARDPAARELLELRSPRRCGRRAGAHHRYHEQQYVLFLLRLVVLLRRHRPESHRRRPDRLDDRIPTIYNADTLGIRPDLVGRTITNWKDLVDPAFKGKTDPRHPVDRHHGCGDGDGSRSAR